MRIIIVNNGTRVLHNFTRILTDHEVKIIDRKDLDHKHISLFDALILTGSSEHSIESNREAYKIESEIVEHSQMPILGICLGFELICENYGAPVRRHKERIEGIKKIHLEQKDKLFDSLHVPTVYENHIYRVEEAPVDFDILATSDSGIESIRHKRKKLYGVQFHPEVYPNRTDGRIILSNFIRIADKQ